MVSVVQREWAAKNPRATFKTPITLEDVLNFADGCKVCKAARGRELAERVGLDRHGARRRGRRGLWLGDPS
jgi:hypothetical protein